jgi:hypothetical protein
MKFNSHKKKFYITFLILFSIVLQTVCATSNSEQNDTTDDEIVLDIEPYTKDTMPNWAHDLRRGEIITFGSLPFTTLTCTFTYSLYRFCYNDFDFDYFPSFFPSSSDEADLDTSEQIGIILTASAISLVIGIADYIIYSTKNKKSLKEAQKHDDIQNGTIVISSSNVESDATENDFGENSDE